MTTYIPSDNPQYGQTQEKFVTMHTQDYLEYGPPPSNYSVVRAKSGHSNATLLYKDLLIHSLDKKYDRHAKGMSNKNPLSPGELAEGPTLAPEMLFGRKDYIGFAHPPLDYAPGMFDWTHHDSWSEALTAAAIFDGDLTMNKDGKKYNPCLNATHYFHDKFKVERKEVYEALSSRTLYHPDDRDSAVFMDEAKCSFTAAMWYRSLIIVCPKVNADGVGWDRIWNTHNRPPVYARWSTGHWQGRNKPLLLGCIPKQPFKGDGSLQNYVSKECHWFNLTPKLGTAFQKQWGRMFNKIDVTKVTVDMRVTPCTPEFFSWLLAATHYKIISGTKISDDALGSWINQYAKHAKARADAGGGYIGEFIYDPAKRAEYGGINVSSRELAGWVMGNYFACKPYAARYEQAFECFIKWEATRSVTDWQDFHDKIHVAGTPPWAGR